MQLFGDMQTREIEIYPKQIKEKVGRKPKLNLRDERSIIRSLYYAQKQDGNFTSKIIKLHDRTVRRVLNKYGFHYRQARRK